jgi:drug/metabolite transporter (DMT)-like permease
MGILFALLASLTLASSQIVLKKSFDQFSPSISFSFNTLFGIIFWIPLATVLGMDFSQLPKVLMIACISGILSEAFFFYILSKGRLCITGTILSTYPIYTILFSTMINHEILVVEQYLFIAVTVFGTILISFPTQVDSEDFQELSKIGWALCGAITTGLADSMAKSAIDISSPGTFLMCLAVTQIPISIIFSKFEKKTFSSLFVVFNSFKRYKIPITGAALNIIGVMFLSLSLQSTPASIASPITATSPAIMVLMSLVFLKESITKVGLIGIAHVVVGVVGISRY